MWGKTQQRAFKEVQGKLSSPPILMSPNWDQPFYASLSVGVDIVSAIY